MAAQVAMLQTEGKIVDAIEDLVQCVSGHVMEVVPDTELEQRCKERASAGSLDAFCRSNDECPECIEDSRQRERRNVELCGAVGCPMTPFDEKSHPCAKSCMASQSYQAIKDSPYDDQLRSLPTKL